MRFVLSSHKIEKTIPHSHKDLSSDLRLIADLRQFHSTSGNLILSSYFAALRYLY